RGNANSLGSREEDPRGRLVLRERRRARDQGLELVERQVADRLEDLLVGPADLTRLLVEVEGRGPFRVERLLQVEEERRLLRVGGGEGAGAGDLVEAEPGATRRLGVLGDAVAVLTMLGDGQGDPLPGRLGENAAAQLGAHAGVGPEDGRSAGEDADKLGDRTAGRLDGLDQRGALVGRRQLIVDLESAYCRFYRQLASRLWLGIGWGVALQSLYVAFTL